MIPWLTIVSFRLVPEFPYTSAHILECEYYVLEELSFQLIIYHPYRPLIQYVAYMAPFPVPGAGFIDWFLA